MASDSDLNDLVAKLDTTDTKKKLTVGQQVIDYLGNPDNAVELDDAGSVIDTLVPWMNSSNFKISQHGLDIVGLLIERMGRGFKPYVNSVTHPVIDRTGDTREVVRERAVFALTKLLEEEVLEPQVLFEKISGAFSHKNGKVREEVLILMQQTLNVYGAQSLTFSRFLPAIVAMLSDPTAPVRDAAFSTLVEIYKYVGERVRMDLQKKYQVPPAKLSILMAKFDTAKASGEMMPTATLGMGTTNDGRGDDETDRMSVKSGASSKSRSSSVPSGKRQVFAAPKPPTADGRSSNASGSSAAVKRNPSMRLGTSVGGQVGAVDEDSFIQAFEEVKKVTIYNGRSLADDLNKIKETLTKTSNDWKVRVDALMMVRSLLLAGADNYDEMNQSLRTLDLPFQSSVKDLRSQVVREACITISYMSLKFRHRVDRFLEAQMQNIIGLIQNSAKVMSTSGIVCMRFIIQNTYSARFLPIIANNMSSKSRDIRRHCCEFLHQVLLTWPTQAMERHVQLLQDAIKKGIADADSDTRSFARKAYWGFADHFKDHADALLNSLDHNHRRMLQSSGGDMSNSSSSNSLNTAGRMSSMSTGSGVHHRPSVPTAARSRQASLASSQENLQEKKSSTLNRKIGSGIPLYTSPHKMDLSASNGSPRQTPPARSNSAIDASAVRRANVRAQYALRARQGLNGGTPFSLRTRKSSDGGGGRIGPPGVPTPDRNGRTGRSRMPVAHSQPGSRSTSPSSLSSYQTYVGAHHKHSPRKRSHGNPFDVDVSDESETSSICSEKSCPDYGRRSSDYGLRGGDSRERLFWDPMVQDIGDIIANCASTHWADRKDGLIGLQCYFRDGRMLSGSELKRVTEIFGRMFMDAHTKVFTLFLDTLIELIVTHKADMCDWLHILLTRLLTKLGGDLLGSIIQKISRTLDIVRDSFTMPEQMTALMRFIGDQALTPNTKVKIATLKHLFTVAQLMESGHVKNRLMLTSAEQEVGLAKIIVWTYEPKSAEVRRQSQAALVALFQLNSSHFSKVLQKLPKVCQENAAAFVSVNAMNESTATLTPDSEDDSTLKPRTLHSPNSPAANQPRKSPFFPRSAIDPVDDSENLNPEDIHKSLRSTANAIQNYSFDSAADAGGASTIDGTSKNLGSSLPAATSVGNGNAEEPADALAKKMSGLQLEKHVDTDHNKEVEGTSKWDEGKAAAAIQGIINELQTVKSQDRAAERRSCMTQLIRMSRDGHTMAIQENFRTILRLLLENLSDEHGSSRALVFGVLTEMVKQESLVPSFQGFTELIILKVLESHKDAEKDVERAAEGCAAALAGVLPVDLIIRVLNPIVKTGDFPVNQAAIKMLTKVAENETFKDIIMSHLEDMMPGLLKAYDNVESSVRKASVFCMVALHQQVGEELQPHLATLNGSKLKLLNLYIKRAQAQSTPATPRVSTPP